MNYLKEIKKALDKIGIIPCFDGEGYEALSTNDQQRFCDAFKEIMIKAHSKGRGELEDFLWDFSLVDSADIEKCYEDIFNEAFIELELQHLIAAGENFESGE